MNAERRPAVLKGLWVIFLLTLPVTSSPLLPAALGGATTVRPLAVLPLIPLTGYLLFRKFFRMRIPRAVIPLALFALIALVGGSLAAVRPVPDFRGVSAVDRVVRNLISLGMAGSFFLVCATIIRTREDLAATVRWLLIGFGIALLWSGLQSLYVLNLQSDPASWEPFYDRLNEIHHWISTRNLQERRVTGMAYEPSWFAEQLTILVTPWLLISAVRRESIFSRSLGPLLVEDLLLLFTAFILVLTFSRTGLVIFSLQLGLTMLIGSGRLKTDKPGRVGRLLGPEKFATRVGTTAIVLIVFGAVVFGLGARNRYFSRMWRFFTEEEAGGSYWTYIAFGQRFVYWEAALNMYAQRPVLGVGLGNFALHFEENLPDIPLYQFPEILDLIVPEQGRTQLVTPKNFFLRVLAETGLVGLAAFAGFWFAVAGTAFNLQIDHREDRRRYYWGRAGILGLSACLLVAFSTDSFAMPNIWVMMGIITAAGQLGWDKPAG